MEYARSQGRNGRWYQWVDRKAYLCIDQVTGALVAPLGQQWNYLWTEDQVRKWLSEWQDCRDRPHIFVEANCIAALKVE